MDSDLWYIRNRSSSLSDTSRMNRKEISSSKEGISARRKLTFLKHLKYIFKKSLITSLPEIFTTSSWKERLWKSLIFIFCLLGFLYQTLSFMEYYWLYPTVVNIDMRSPFHVVQPAVTFCSNNRVRRNIYCERNMSACLFYNDKNSFCSEYPNFCFGNDTYKAVPNMKTALEDLLTNGSWSEVVDMAPTEEIINNCTKIVDGKDLPCSIRSFPFVTSDSKPTFCYTIDSHVNEPDATDDFYPNTFRINIFLLTFSYEYFFHSDPVIIYATVHNRKRLVNPFEEGAILKGGYAYKAYVSMTEVLRLPYPYSTNCTDYNGMWKRNNGTGPLTEVECIEYCKLDKIRSAGLCVDDQITYSHIEELCEKDKTTMTKEILERCNSMCQPACQEEIYEVKYDEMQFLHHLCNKEDEACKSGFISLQFFFRNFRLTERIYDPKYRSVELFSYIGGYMGMWLGLSLISVFDFFESLCLVLYYPIKKRIKKDN